MDKSNSLAQSSPIQKLKISPNKQSSDVLAGRFSKNQKKIQTIKFKKVSNKKIKISFFIIRHKEQIAFLKKPNLSFFDGFEHLPNSQDEFSSELFTTSQSKKIKDLKYTITNHNFQIKVFEFFTKSRNKKFKWFDLKDIASIPLPTLYKKILVLVP